MAWYDNLTQVEIDAMQDSNSNGGGGGGATVELVDSVTSTSTTKAPTAKALKSVNDAVVLNIAALNNVNNVVTSNTTALIETSTIASEAKTAVGVITNIEIPALKFASKDKPSIVSHIVNVDIPYKAKNASTPLVIPTFEGGGQQTTHPSVVYFPEKWNGWKYWMAHTPYPDADSSKEDPSMVVSQDGINWEIPDGINSPIFRNPGAGFYSDVDIVYQPIEDRLYLFFRYVLNPNTFEQIFVSFSDDGISWSPMQETLRTNQWILSPSFVFDGKQWSMWYVGQDNLSQSPSGATSSVRYRVSDNPFGGWSQQVNTNLIGNCLGNDNVGIWHIDVNKYADEYHMIICSYTFDLYLATSTDKLTWKVNKNNPILKKAIATNPTGFDASRLYRATGILEKTSTGYLYKIWYGAVSVPGKWTVGYTELHLNGSTLKLNPQTPDEKGLIIEGLTTQTVPLLEIHSHGLNQKILTIKYNDVERFFYEQGVGLRLTQNNEAFLIGPDGGTKIRFLTNGSSGYLQSGISADDTNATLSITRLSSGENLKALEVYANTSLFKGDVELDNLTKGVILKAPDASRWRVQIGNDGVLKTTKL